MTTATLSPYTSKEGTKVGKRTYRKQILPLGTINYQGRQIHFDRPFLTDLAESFTSGAYDQVPFVLADVDNRHNMDPERFRGEIKAFELSEDGLDAIVEFTADGAAAVEANPRLGVSARIVEGLAKADGRTFKRAIQHVLGTMDPRVTGLRPWTAIDLAVYTDGEQVVDLTDERYEENKMTAPAQVDQTATDSTTDTDKSKPLDLSGLSDEEFEALLEAADSETVEGEDGEVEDKPADPKEGTVQEVSLSTVVDGKDDITVGADGKPVQTVTEKQVDLAVEVVDSSARTEVAQMRIDLAAERWKSERKDLVRAGVPPFIVDLAAPILSSPDTAVIDLSNSATPVNATDVIRNLVNATKGIVDLTPEVGHSVDLSHDDSGDAALLAAWDSEYGTA